MDKAKLILIRGLPNSGKSTLAMDICDTYIRADWFEADHYFESFDENDELVYNFDASQLSNAHDWCYTEAANSLKEGNLVIVSNTFTTIKEMQPYVDLAKQFDAELQVITCTGVIGDNGHGVPASTVEKMRNRFVHKLPEEWFK